MALARRHERSWLVRRSLLAGWLTAATAAAAAASPLIAAAWAQRGQEHWLKKPGLRTLAALRYLIGPPALVIVVLLVIGCAVAISALRGRTRACPAGPAGRAGCLRCACPGCCCRRRRCWPAL